jgi:pimeloyl-ACP methyl ester carboxylesterase
MSELSPGNTNPIALSSRLTLWPAGQWSGEIETLPPAPLVLGDDSANQHTSPFADFTLAEPAIELDARPVPAPQVLGDEEPEPAGFSYQPQTGQAYALLQEITTPDGVIYDITLPKPMPAKPTSGVLSAGDSEQTLWFPLKPTYNKPNAAPPAPGVLGVEDMLEDLASEVVIKRVVKILKTPITNGLKAQIQKREPKPQIIRYIGDNSYEPLEDADDWHQHLASGKSYRVLLFIHGFGSSVESCNLGPMLDTLKHGYDLIIGYNHPSITVNPLQNAQAFLAQIPSDLRMSVDILAHSRGGLVARSLIELSDPIPQIEIRRLVTHGSPHNGTRLADPERWDRFISIGLTAASWLANATGVAAWIPSAFELVLKAACQGVFDLEGIGAMTPEGEFIKTINQANDKTLYENTRYSAVVSQIKLGDKLKKGYNEAFASIVAEVFINEPHDLVVPTASMSAIDSSVHKIPKDRLLKLNLDHFSYFQEPKVWKFVQQQLALPKA